MNQPQATKKTIGSKRILVLGNSLAAGYGLEKHQSFPSLLQDRIDSLGWKYTVDNAGISGETTAGGLSRIDGLLQDTVDVLILELGANDGLRGMPVRNTRANLQAIIDRTRKKYPDVRIILTGMMMPPNFGREYFEEYRRLFPALAEENEIELVPFLLEGVAGVAHLNQGDGVHPTAEGQRYLANNVWRVLEPVLKEMNG